MHYCLLENLILTPGEGNSFLLREEMRLSRIRLVYVYISLPVVHT